MYEFKLITGLASPFWLCGYCIESTVQNTTPHTEVYTPVKKRITVYSSLAAPKNNTNLQRFHRESEWL